MSKVQELRAAVERSIRAASAAKSEATREFYLKRAKMFEALAKDVAWLDSDSGSTLNWTPNKL